jgi:hypothetical protein
MMSRKDIIKQKCSKIWNRSENCKDFKTGQRCDERIYQSKKKQLDDYTSGVRKSKPGKAMLNILEKKGVISK